MPSFAYTDEVELPPNADGDVEYEKREYEVEYTICSAEPDVGIFGRYASVERVWNAAGIDILNELPDSTLESIADRAQEMMYD